MNGCRKFHSPDGPAFNVGEHWRSISGKINCWITERVRYGPEKWDVKVTYKYSDGATHSKDAWNFQVRYQHTADEVIK